MARAIGWALVAYLGAHWAEALLYEPRLRINPSDLVLAVALVLAAPALWRERPVLVAPLPLLAAAAALSLLVSTVAAGDPISADLAGRLGVQVCLVVLGCVVFGAPTLAPARVVFERGAVTIALAMAVVALVGGALGAAGVLDGLEPVFWRPAFVDRTGNSTLGELPRLVGGLSFSAETCGLWAVAAASVLVGAAVRRRAAWWWFALPAAAAIGTLSIGGASIALVATWWLATVATMRRPARLAVAGAAVVVLLALQLPVHRGPAVETTPTAEVCVEDWPNHWAQWRSTDEQRCAIRTWSDGHALTRYALAKRHAFELWSAHPVLGVGDDGFAHHAAAEEGSTGWRSWNPYYTTHGTWHGVAAEQGAIGLAILIALVIALVRALRRGFTVDAATATVLAALLLAFAAASIDLDVHRQRLLWLAIGAAAGLSARAARDQP